MPWLSCGLQVYHLTYKFATSFDADETISSPIMGALHFGSLDPTACA